MKVEKIDFETVLVEATKLPMVKINRENFLRKEFQGRYKNEVVEMAIQHCPAYAGIKVEEINEIAESCIKYETTKVTAISAVTGLPGGFAMLGTIPADLVQYFGHIFRILQKLIYLYGWQDLSLDSNEITEETKYLLTLFTGVMFGVNGAVKAVNKISGQLAKQIIKKLPQKTLTKGIYNLSDLELQIKSYEFLKFKLYSGISYIRLNPENQFLRQPDVSVTSAGQRDTSGSNLTVGPACH